jgi:hypothetical protein
MRKLAQFKSRATTVFRMCHLLDEIWFGQIYAKVLALKHD